MKRIFIDSCKIDADIVVVGSSRVKLISEDMFHGKSMINLAVDGATYNDIAALLYYYIHKHGKPSMVIIGIDPQHFNANIRDTRWKTLQYEYTSFSADILGEDMPHQIDFVKWGNIFSLRYFQKSCNHFYENILDSTDSYLFVSDSIINGKDILPGRHGLCADGSLIYGNKKISLSREERRTEAQTLQYGQWKNYYELSNEYKHNWQLLVDYIKDQGIKIYFWQSAYHPITYERLITEDENIEMKHAMEYINEFAKENNIEIIGAYNPSDLHLDEDDFLDGMHMRKHAVRKYIESFAFE